MQTDLKNVTHVDTSSFAQKTKTEVDKLDIDKLAPVPVDLSKLSDAVKNNVEKINLAKHTIDLLLLLASMRLDMSRIQSYINSMRNIMILIRRISI